MEGNTLKEIIPEWLTHSFIEKSLQCGLKCPELKLFDFNCEMASSVGDNYCSKIIRVNSTISKGDKEYCEKMTAILKIPIIAVGEFTTAWNMFEKEGDALYKLLPQIHSILKRFNKEHEPFWPNCYYAMTHPNQALVLEDLRPAGFVLADKCVGLDMDHCTLVLTSMAKLHAASLVLTKENPDAIEPFKALFWSGGSAVILETFMRPSFRKYSEIILNWTEFENRQFYSKFLRRFADEIVEEAAKLWKREDSKINVILHGDCWINNYMFKYLPSGKVSGVKFVDFQFVSLNSPVMDLHNFIFTSAAPELMFNKMDTLLQIYHQAFVSTLNELNYSISYTFDELKEDFDRKCKWGLIYFVACLPLIIQSASTATAEDFFDEKKMEKQLETIDLEKVRKVFKVGLLFFEKKGVFDTFA